MFQVLIEQAAARDLKRLEKVTLKRIIPILKKLADDPRPPGCHKITGSKNDWRIRIGEYRIIYEIDEKAREVRIMRIKHRKDVYR
jgi:mRNA interferase RelE/StbE